MDEPHTNDARFVRSKHFGIDRQRSAYQYTIPSRRRSFTQSPRLRILKKRTTGIVSHPDFQRTGAGNCVIHVFRPKSRGDKRSRDTGEEKSDKKEKRKKEKKKEKKEKKEKKRRKRRKRRKKSRD